MFHLHMGPNSCRLSNEQAPVVPNVAHSCKSHIIFKELLFRIFHKVSHSTTRGCSCNLNYIDVDITECVFTFVWYIVYSLLRIIEQPGVIQAWTNIYVTLGRIYFCHHGRGPWSYILSTFIPVTETKLSSNWVYCCDWLAIRESKI